MTFSMSGKSLAAILVLGSLTIGLTACADNGRTGVTGSTSATSGTKDASAKKRKRFSPTTPEVHNDYGQ